MGPEEDDSLAAGGAIEVAAEDEVAVDEVEDKAEGKAWEGCPPSPPRALQIWMPNWRRTIQTQCKHRD